MLVVARLHNDSEIAAVYVGVRVGALVVYGDYVCAGVGYYGGYSLELARLVYKLNAEGLCAAGLEQAAPCPA